MNWRLTRRGTKHVLPCAFAVSFKLVINVLPWYANTWLPNGTDLRGLRTRQWGSSTEVKEVRNVYKNAAGAWEIKRGNRFTRWCGFEYQIDRGGFEYNVEVSWSTGERRVGWDSSNRNWERADCVPRERDLSIRIGEFRIKDRVRGVVSEVRGSNSRWWGSIVLSITWRILRWSKYLPIRNA